MNDNVTSWLKAIFLRDKNQLSLFVSPMRWLLVFVGISLFLILKSAPANLMVGVLGRHFPQADLSGVSGSLWQGKASSMVIHWQGEAYAFGKVKWDLNPWSLLLLSVCGEFETKLSRQTTKGQACFNPFGDIQVSDGEFYGSSNILALWLPVQVSGNLSLRIEKLVLSNNYVKDIAASVSWSKAKYHNSVQWLDFGTLAAEVKHDEESGDIQADVFSIEGPVKLDIKAQLPYLAATNQYGEVTLNGSLALKPDAQEQLKQGIDLLGFNVVDGKYQIKWP